MTPRDRAAWNAAVEAARQMALTAAVTLEVRDDAGAVRQQAAAAALHGLAEGLRAMLIPAPDPCIPPDIYRDTGLPEQLRATPGIG